MLLSKKEQDILYKITYDEMFKKFSSTDINNAHAQSILSSIHICQPGTMAFVVAKATHDAFLSSVEKKEESKYEDRKITSNSNH